MTAKRTIHIQYCIHWRRCISCWGQWIDARSWSQRSMRTHYPPHNPPVTHALPSVTDTCSRCRVRFSSHGFEDLKNTWLEKTVDRVEVRIDGPLPQGALSCCGQWIDAWSWSQRSMRSHYPPHNPAVAQALPSVTDISSRFRVRFSSHAFHYFKKLMTGKDTLQGASESRKNPPPRCSIRLRTVDWCSILVTAIRENPLSTA